MFIIVNHLITDPRGFHDCMIIASKRPLPAEIQLHWVGPSQDQKRTFCLWETSELKHVQNYLEETFGNTSINEYVPINESLSVGLVDGLVNEVKLKSQRRQIELEMQMLRAQMNPHFIFNSLNSINRFILSNDPKSASSYLTKFSRLVRLILQNSQSQEISLENELEALQLYLQLEMIRFEHRFEYCLICDQTVDASFIKLPPMLLQPYVENAIWHGLMHKSDKGHLRIELCTEGDLLVCKISDDGIGRQKAAELNSKSATRHKSMGTIITARRLAMMEKMDPGGEAIVIKDLIDPAGNALGTEVTLRIPFAYD